MTLYSLLFALVFSANTTELELAFNEPMDLPRSMQPIVKMTDYHVSVADNTSLTIFDRSGALSGVVKAEEMDGFAIIDFVQLPDRRILLSTTKHLGEGVFDFQLFLFDESGKKLGTVSDTELAKTTGGFYRQLWVLGDGQIIVNIKADAKYGNKAVFLKEVQLVEEAGHFRIEHLQELATHHLENETDTKINLAELSDGRIAYTLRHLARVHFLHPDDEFFYEKKGNITPVLPNFPVSNSKTTGKILGIAEDENGNFSFVYQPDKAKRETTVFRANDVEVTSSQWVQFEDRLAWFCEVNEHKTKITLISR